jgi:hypothetical protein
VCCADQLNPPRKAAVRRMGGYGMPARVTELMPSFLSSDARRLLSLEQGGDHGE